MVRFPKASLAAGGLLFIHVLFSLHGISRLSPTWDEIAYPAAGLSQLKTGRLDLNTVNPFLSKLIYAVPLLLGDIRLPFDHPSWEKKDEYRFGFQFTYRNAVPPARIVFLSRLPVVGLSALAALLIFMWARSLWGGAGGLAALGGYLSTPIFLSRAVVAQLEMPVYVFILAALWCHFRWFETESIRYFIFSALLAGLALLGKLIALPLVATVVILNLGLHPKRRSWSVRAGIAVLYVIIVLAVLTLCYLPWTGGWDAYKVMWRNLFLFDKIIPFYWAGRTYEHVLSLISWAAVLIKAPLHVLILSGMGAWMWWRSGKFRSAFYHFSLLALCSALPALFFKNPASTVQFSPIYLGLIPLMGALSLVHRRKDRLKKAVAIAVMLLGVIDVYSVHPHYLSYFNRLVGGSKNGYHWLADSDQDWGQNLPALSSALKRRNPGGILLAYSGSGDPAAYGIRYQDLLSPALVTKEHPGRPIKADAHSIVLAVGTKVIQSEPLYLQWLRTNVKPDEMVAHTFLLYDISSNAEAFRWLAEIYSDTGRTDLARRMKERANRIELSYNNRRS